MSVLEEAISAKGPRLDAAGVLLSTLSATAPRTDCTNFLRGSLARDSGTGRARFGAFAIQNDNAELVVVAIVYDMQISA
jgi:hypothetical protein